jgi:hypothetical protein
VCAGARRNFGAGHLSKQIWRAIQVWRALTAALDSAEGEIIMQDRNQTGHDRNPAGRNPNPAGLQKGHRVSGQKPPRTGADAPRVDSDAERRADPDRRPDISRAPGERTPMDPKDTGATGQHGLGTTPRTERDAPGPGSQFVRGSGTWRSMKSWQPWALIGAAVLLVIIGLIVL